MTLLAALEHLNHGATSAHQLLDSDADSGNIWLCAQMDPPSPVLCCGFHRKRMPVSGQKRECCETWWRQAGSTSPMFVWNESRGRAKEGSGFGQSLICSVPQESLAASPGSRAVWWGSSSAGASRHIWKQTFGLRLQPMCQVWCVSGKVCCKDHHPQDWGGESGESQMAGKNLISKSAFLFIFLQILFTWSPSSQVHLLFSPKDFFFCCCYSQNVMEEFLFF